jgi:hypothetical protein
MFRAGYIPENKNLQNLTIPALISYVVAPQKKTVLT